MRPKENNGNTKDKYDYSCHWKQRWYYGIKHCSYWRGNWSNDACGHNNAATATTVSAGTQANITTCANLTVTGALSPLNVTRADASTAGGGAALSCTASAVCGVITITTASAATSAITVTNTTITSADSIVFLQAGAGVPATTLLTISSVFAGGATQFVIGISTTAVPANAKISFLVVS